MSILCSCTLSSHSFSPLRRLPHASLVCACVGEEVNKNMAFLMKVWRQIDRYTHTLTIWQKKSTHTRKKITIKIGLKPFAIRSHNILLTYSMCSENFREFSVSSFFHLVFLERLWAKAKKPQQQQQNSPNSAVYICLDFSSFSFDFYSTWFPFSHHTKTNKHTIFIAF